jgi:hypothetical protein
MRPDEGHFWVHGQALEQVDKVDLRRSECAVPRSSFVVDHRLQAVLIKCIAEEGQHLLDNHCLGSYCRFGLVHEAVEHARHRDREQPVLVHPRPNLMLMLHRVEKRRALFEAWDERALCKRLE